MRLYGLYQTANNYQHTVEIFGKLTIIRIVESYSNITLCEEVNKVVYIITGAFILLDLITGLIKAFKEKSYTSSLMREGLYHKAGSIIIILFGCLVDYAQTFIDIGVNIPVAISVCSYIVLMEIGSIIENVCVINPQILPEKIKGYFKKLSNTEDK